MTDWADLSRELDRWGQEKRAATWWWRDDDAVEDTPQLRQLLKIAQDGLALAVIPDGMQPGLAKALEGYPDVFVLQHGFSHKNQAAPGERKSEFPNSRAVGEIDAAFREGYRRLEAAFGSRFLPVLTPPWNRIGTLALPRLRNLGFKALSRYQMRSTAEFHGILQVNTHVDVIDWAGSRGFLGESACLGLLIAHLSARRTGLADRDEPTGLLTHHIVHDAATWRFLQKLRDFLSQQSAARLLDPATAFRQG